MNLDIEEGFVGQLISKIAETGVGVPETVSRVILSSKRPSKFSVEILLRLPDMYAVELFSCMRQGLLLGDAIVSARVETMKP